MANLYVEDDLTDEGELGPVNVCLFLNENLNVNFKWKIPRYFYFFKELVKKEPDTIEDFSELIKKRLYLRKLDYLSDSDQKELVILNLFDFLLI